MASILDRPKPASLLGSLKNLSAVGTGAMASPAMEEEPVEEPTEGGDLDPQRAGYVDVAPKCGDCEYFQAPNACQIVSGPISEGGWCKIFEKGEGGMDELASMPEEPEATA